MTQHEGADHAADRAGQGKSQQQVLVDIAEEAMAQARHARRGRESAMCTLAEASAGAMPSPSSRVELVTP